MTTARPTLYKGIQMRSRLEADFAACLDRDGFWDWEYEPVCFGGPDGQWLPDFKRRVAAVNGHQPFVPEYVEVKPFRRDDALSCQVITPILRKMSVAWLTDPGAHLALVFWRYGASEPVVEFHGRESRDSEPWLVPPHYWSVRFPTSAPLGAPLIWPSWLDGRAPATPRERARSALLTRPRKVAG